MSKGFIVGIIVFIVFDAIVTFFILWRHFKKPKLSQNELQYIQSHWIRIIDSFNGNPKQAVMDADKLLDYALIRNGYGEGNLGEKLKKANGIFGDINGVWFAHKLRNKVAHELGEINFNDAKDALKCFKRALNDLGAGL